MKNKNLNTRKIRHFLYMLLVAILFISCDSNTMRKSNINTKSINKSSIHIDRYEMRIVKHEEHEYIILIGGASWGNGLAICHSESCQCKNIK